jgi:hypothetical protein
MATRSYIGKTIFLAMAAPATNTSGGFEALTWVKVNGLQVLPQLGVSHSNIDVPDLQTGFTLGIKGAGAGMDSQMSFRIVSGDQGQTNLKLVADSASGVCSVKIVRGTGALQAPALGDETQYATGYAHSYQEVQGTDSAHEGFTVNFKQNAPTIVATHPAP